MARLLRAVAAIGAAVLIFSMLKNKGAENTANGEGLRDKAEEAVEKAASAITE